MTQPQAHRDLYRPAWLALAREAALCAADPTRDVGALKIQAKAGRKGWLWPSEDRQQNWQLAAFRQLADAYAHQQRMSVRRAMAPALAVMAQIALGLLGAAAAGPEGAARPELPFRADIDG